MRGKRWVYPWVLGFVVVLAGAQGVLAAGFALYEGSARGNALGGALVGRADDPSALYYNPAGITQLPGLQLMAGATIIMPTTDVTIGGIRETTKDNVWIPPHLYATYQFSDRLWFGLAMYSPFGLGTEFDENWLGRYNSYKALIETFSVNPNVAFKLTDKLSLAAGFSVMYFDLTLDRKIPTGQPFWPFPMPWVGDVDADLTGDSFGYGWNVALHYQPCEYAKFGIAYRSQVKQNLSGSAKFTIPAVGENIYRPFLHNTDATGAVTLPDEVYVGLAVYPMKNLSLELGGVWTGWSDYSQLVIAYDRPVAGRKVSVVSKDWHDVWRLNFGIEYKPLNWLDLRFGYVFDEEPIPDRTVDYLVPANDRHLFSFGPGFHWNNWTLDVSYTYLLITDRDVEGRPLDGVFTGKFENGDAHMVGVSLGYKF
ncbi:MAG TPA: OmpP1/FadL family transporter [Syntrophobacteraceae bacterium]|nr:OmpP1/FadL family transporter [Syntrophobacteraceae bacterium]